MGLRLCKECKSEIDALHLSKKYCSHECSYKSKKRRESEKYYKRKAQHKRSYKKQNRLVEFIRLFRLRLIEFIFYTILGIGYYRNYDRFYWRNIIEVNYKNNDD